MLGTGDWNVAMHLSWSEHLTAARTLELAGSEQLGTALALMGIALLLLLNDLSEEEHTNDQHHFSD